MANPQKLITKTQRAIQYFQSGNTVEAKKILDEVCRQKANIDVAWFLLATINFQIGNLEPAKKYFKEAIRLNPSHFEAMNNLGVVFERLGDVSNAEKYYKEAIQTKPDYASAHFHLGNLRQNNNNIPSAVDLYQRTLAYNPNHIKGLNNLALIYIEQQKYAEALVLLHHANSVAPNDAEIITNIGFALREQGELDEALIYFEKAVSMDNPSANAFNHMGVLYQQLDNDDMAEKSYVEALKRNPDDPETLTNLGNHYEKHGQHERAKEAFEKAISIDPSYGAAWNNLGANLKTQGHLSEAIKIYEQGEKLSPASAEIRYNLGVSQLATGQLEKGWKNYLFRPSFHNEDHATTTEILPTKLREKRILVVNDQGLGDELFFLRFMPLLKERGAEISYFPQQKIRSLVQQFDCIDHIVDTRENDSHFNYVLNIGNLPYLLQSGNKTPQALSLEPDPKSLERVKALLHGFGPPPYIGLTWRGGTKVKAKLFKEIKVADFAEALKDTKATYIALQRNPEPGEIEELSALLAQAVHDATELNENLEDMLALLSQLDLYIGVSNTNMHISAALAKKAMVLVPHPGEWRWMAEGNCSNWFEGFTVYRQDKDKNWDKATHDIHTFLASTYHEESN